MFWRLATRWTGQQLGMMTMTTLQVLLCPLHRRLCHGTATCSHAREYHGDHGWGDSAIERGSENLYLELSLLQSKLLLPCPFTLLFCFFFFGSSHKPCLHRLFAALPLLWWGRQLSVPGDRWRRRMGVVNCVRRGRNGRGRLLCWQSKGRRWRQAAVRSRHGLCSRTVTRSRMYQRAVRLLVVGWRRRGPGSERRSREIMDGFVTERSWLSDGKHRRMHKRAYVT